MSRFNPHRWLIPLGLLIHASLQAQVSDCIDAVPICQPIFQQTQAPLGEGNFPDEIPDSSCLITAEKSGSWYRFTIQQGGELCFSIFPNNPSDDYDWAVYHLTDRSCSDIPAGLAPEVSCNYAPNSGCGGITGPNGVFSQNCPDQHEPCLEVLAGETYVVYVSQFTASSTQGYTIDFTSSSATIFDQDGPQLAQAHFVCDTPSIKFDFSEPILCASLTPSDLRLTGLDGEVPMYQISSLACESGQLFGQHFSAKVKQGALRHGSYQLTVVGDIEDRCANIIPLNQSQPLAWIEEALTLSFENDSLCEGDSLQLTHNFSAFSSYQFVWTSAPDIAAPHVSPAQSTLYHLSVTSPGGCQYRDSAWVFVKPNPVPLVMGPDSTCLKSPARFSLAESPPDGSTLNWDWDGGTPIFSPSEYEYDIKWPAPGAYQVLATTSLNGCIANSEPISITVLPHPAVEAGPDTFTCIGLPLQLHGVAQGGDSDIHYRWFQDSIWGTPISDQLQLTVSPQLNSQYFLMASQHGCNSEPDSVLVFVYPEIIAAITADTTAICEGESVQLTAFGGQGSAQFRWSPATGLSAPSAYNPIASPSRTTTYSVTINEGICVDSTSINITVYPRPEADYFNTLASGCEWLEVAFMENTTDALNYEWDFGDGSPVDSSANPVHFYQSPGHYPVTLKVSGVAGCRDSSTQTTVNVSRAPHASAISIPEFGRDIPVGTSVNLIAMGEGISSCLWSMGDGGMTTGPEAQYAYDRPGKFTVELSVTGENGCTQTMTLGSYEVFVPSVERQNVFTPNGDGANDEFRIQYDGRAEYEVFVYDRWGRKLFSSRSSSHGWNGLTPGGEPAREGVYFYVATIEGKTFKGSITLLR